MPAAPDYDHDYRDEDDTDRESEGTARKAKFSREPQRAGSEWVAWLQRTIPLFSRRRGLPPAVIRILYSLLCDGMDLARDRSGSRKKREQGLHRDVSKRTL